MIRAPKVKLAPATVISLLGLVLDFQAGLFRDPRRRQVAFQVVVHQLIAAGDRAPAQRLAKVAGTAQLFRMAMGPVVYFFTRHIYITLESGEHWGSWIDNTSEVLQELRFWESLDFDSFAQSIWQSLHWGQGRLKSDADAYGDA